MSLPVDIILAADTTFSLITQYPTSSLRGIAAAPLDKPVTLRVAHDTAKSGRVSSVIQVKLEEFLPCDANACNTAPTMSNVTVQLKISYDPTDGSTTTDDRIESGFEYVNEIMTTTALWDKFKNKET